MIVIIDNGKGAHLIARAVRSASVVKPSAAPDADGYILSDGSLNTTTQKANIALIKSCTKPLLGIGVGYVALGLAFGASKRPSTCPHADRITIRQRSPILLDLPKTFSAITEHQFVLADLPDCLSSLAGCTNCSNEVITHSNASPRPLFGVHFNPELGGDASKVLQNFVKFVEMWKKYH